MSEHKTQDTIAILATSRIQYHVWNVHSTFSFIFTDNKTGRIQKWSYTSNGNWFADSEYHFKFNIEQSVTEIWAFKQGLSEVIMWTYR